MSLAQQPYSEVDCFEMAAYLREGYRIAHPINCPDELYVTNQHSDFLFQSSCVNRWQRVIRNNDHLERNFQGPACLILPNDFFNYSLRLLAENGSSDMHTIWYEGTFLLFAGIAWCLVVGPKIQMRDQSFHSS